MFLAELKRRKVTRVAVVYALVGIGVIEAADLILPRMTAPEVVLDILVLAVVLGFPIALVLAWAVDLTPEGIQRTPGLTPEELAAQGPVGWRASSWVLFGAALAVVGAGGYFAFFRGGGSETTESVSAEASSGLVENRVAVMPFENRTGREDLETLGDVVAEVLTEGLIRTEMVEVVPTSVTIPFAREAGSGSSEIVLEGRAWTLADETKAGTVVRGAYYVLGDSLRIQAEISDEQNQSVFWSEQVTWLAADPMGGIGELRQRVLTAMAVRFDPRMVEEFEGWFGERLPRYEAYEAHMLAMDAIFGLSQNGNQALSLSLRAFELDSTFFAPLINAAYLSADPAVKDSLLDIVEAHRDDLSSLEGTSLEIFRARTHGRLQDEYLASRAWTGTQAGVGQGLWQHGWAALRVNRPHEASEVLLKADPDSHSLRGEVGYWTSVTETYHLLGRHEEELDVARQGRELFPGSPTAMRNELMTLAALGRVEGVLAGLEELITLTTGSPTARLLDISRELQRHGHRAEAGEVLDRALSWYESRPPSELETQTSRYSRAITHYLAGEWDEAEALFTGIRSEELTGDRTADRRRLVFSVGYLGAMAARRGDREEALRLSEELANVDFSFLNGLHTLWRGRIAALLGDREEAMALLLEAHAQGRPFGWSWHRDVDLESLRDYPPFQEFLRPKG